MKVKVLGSTQPGHNLSLEDAMLFAGHSAGICYMKESTDELFAEDREKTLDRAMGTIVSGHHSVFDHVIYNLEFNEAPKILAMLLNNEKAYATSEKSARWTKMKPAPQEQILYDKWLAIFTDRVLELYPDMDRIAAGKKAQENARYLISVFTPTTMEYTASLRQINYIRHWFMDFIAEDYYDDFFDKVKPVMADFIENTQFLHVDGLRDSKQMKVSLFDRRANRKNQYGETYTVTYRGSFAQLAQAHRHRTLDYKMSIPKIPVFYVPLMIEDHELCVEWLADIKTVAEFYPQGLMVNILERGTYDNFILKTQERLCSCAQLEVSRQTFATLQVYKLESRSEDGAVADILDGYTSSARCGNGYVCPKPCVWGLKQLDRLV